MFFCGEKNIWLNIKKSQNIMEMIADLIKKLDKNLI